MKKLVVVLVAMIASVTAAVAQNYMVVDSEKIFKSMTEYTSALSELETLSEKYQESVDAKFETLAQNYNTYAAQRNTLSAAERTARESAILKEEEAAEEFQAKYFAEDGELMERRIELISPIQKRVFDAIENYSEANGFDLVLDLASNATILYKSNRVDRTEAIIELLK